MRKFIVSLLVVMALSSASFALDDIALPTDGSFYDGAVIAAQVDGNDITVPTAYTPRRQGDILVGGAGTGTNAVWTAAGLTSNDWVQAGVGTDLATINAAIAAADLAISNLITVAYKAWVAPQVDPTSAGTNTVPTAFTPKRIGDVLVGAMGITNQLWLSKGTTTNDWLQVEP